MKSKSYIIKLFEMHKPPLLSKTCVLLVKLAAFIIHKVTNKEADIELLKKIHGKIK
jgi:hypothetical protein